MSDAPVPPWWQRNRLITLLFALIALVALAGVVLQYLAYTPHPRPSPAVPTRRPDIPSNEGVPLALPQLALSPANAAAVRLLGDWHTASTGRGGAVGAAFSADGQRLVIGSDAGLDVYDARTLERIEGWDASPGLEAMALAPDGQAVALALSDGRVQLWRPGAHEPLPDFSDRGGPVSRLAFAPGGDALATVAAGGTIRLRRLSDGALLRDFGVPGEQVSALAFMPGGATLLAGTDEGTLHEWRVADGSLVRTLVLSPANKGKVLGVAVAPDGRTVAATASLAFELWHDAADGAGPDRIVYLGVPVTGVAFGGSPLAVAAGAPDGSVVLRAADSGAELRRFVACRCPVSALAFAPDGTVLVTADMLGARVWDVAGGALRREFGSGAQPPAALAIAPDNETLAAGGPDGLVRLWRVSDRTLLRVWSVDQPVLALAFSPYGKSLATLSPDGLGLWRVADGSFVDRMGLSTAGGFYPQGLAFVPDGVEFPLELSPNCQPALWRHSQWLNPLVWLSKACGGRRIAVLNAPVYISRDGRWIAVRFDSRDSPSLVGVASTAGGLPLQPPIDDFSRKFAVSADAQLVATVVEDASIQLWHVGDDTPLTTLSWPTDAGPGMYGNLIVSLAFSPDGRYLVSATNDGTLRVWGVR